MTNRIRSSTTPLAFQGMSLFYMPPSPDRCVNYVPGVVCKPCARFVPSCSPGREPWVAERNKKSPGGAAPRQGRRRMTYPLSTWLAASRIVSGNRDECDFSFVRSLECSDRFPCCMADLPLQCGGFWVSSIPILKRDTQKARPHKQV